MGLQIWLPLNGDLTNNGLATTTFSGTPTWKTYGKLSGKSLNLQNRVTCSTPSLNGVQFFSIAFWGRIEANADSTANWMDVIGFTDISTGGTSGQFRFETGYGNTAYGGIHWHDNATNAVINGSYTYNTASEYNNWHHIVVTVSDTAVKSYYDGKLKQTHTTNLNKGHLNGNWWLGESTTQGCIQDVRIYDYALSDKEVEEIAKGLVLHYKLDNNGRGNPNLIPNTSPHEVQYTYPSGNTYNDKFAATTSIIPSASQYILSFDAKSTVVGDKVRAHYYNPNTTTRCETNQGVITTATDGNIDFTLSTQWEHYWVIYTQSSTTAVKRIIFPRMFGPDRTEAAKGSGTVSVRNLKFEEGTVSTIWQPNSNDSLYSSFNFNDILYDSSGYNNNGEIIGTVKLSSDTGRYFASTNMNNINTTNHIECINELTLPTEGITATLWVKSTKSTNQVIFTTPQIQFGTLNSLGYCFPNTNQNGWTLNNFINNDWNFIAITRVESTIKLYVNGVLETQSGAANNYNHNKNVLWLLNRGNNNSYAGNASISDFRIYATALTESQIQELYHTSATIDNQGNIYARELVEL